VKHIKGIIYEDSDEGITLKYDPNTQFITFWDDEIKYDQMDCSFFSNWSSVVKELQSEYGINLFYGVHHLGEKEGEGATLLQLRVDEAHQWRHTDD
jgi:hypothetical protein